MRGLEKYYDTDLFLTEVLTREAIEALREPIARRQPFFLYMAHYAVHVPYEEDKRFTASTGAVTTRSWAPLTLNENEVRYAALVEGWTAAWATCSTFSKHRPKRPATRYPLHVGQRRAGTQQRPPGG